MYPVLGNLSTSTSTDLHPVLVYVLKFPIQDGLPYLFLYSNFHEVRSFVSVNSQWTGIQKYVCVMVSSGTRQCNFLGQRDRSFFIVPGQRDNLKILPWNGTGRDSKSISGTGRGMGQSLLCCQNPGQDYFFPTISCFGTSFHVLEHKFSVLEHPIHVLERPFHVFWFFWEI